MELASSPSRRRSAWAILAITVPEDLRLAGFKALSIGLALRGGEGPHMLVSSFALGRDEAGVCYIDFDPNSMKNLAITLDSSFKS
jgi:hypothetical protein